MPAPPLSPTPLPARPALPSEPGRAVLLMVLATALFAGTTLLAKALGTGALGPALHPLQVSFGRFLFAWITILAVAAVLRPSFGRPALGLHAARTLCGWGGATLMFAAAARMPLSDATALSFLSPVLTMLLAIPLLGERVGPWRWGAAAIAMIGAMILLRPGPGTFQVAGLLALGAALVMGVEAILIKRLTSREAPVPVLVINNGMGVAIALLPALAVWAAPNAAQWAALAGIGVVMVGGQAAFLLALRRADASFAAPLFYLTLVFATVYDFAAFGVRPDAISLIGAAVLVSGAVLLALREGRQRRGG